MKSVPEEIKRLIESESPVAPLTDEEIAARLGVSRVTVTLARKNLGLPDSRDRLKPHLVDAFREIMARRPGISERAMTAELRARGFDVSRFTIARLRDQAPVSGAGAVTTTASPIPEPLPMPSQETGHSRAAFSDAFSRILGSDGSLKPVVQQAKAAVLYPPRGLHTLILGPSGVGKTELAEAMSEFARQVRGLPLSEMPFVAFNCADYADNPQLLLTQLFGHVKGAFTGAETTKTGLVDKANGGILFLDEVHRLPSEGQEILFHLMDRGRFRRLGQTEAELRADVMLIAATTENPDSSLLITFRRRIPMVIELPSLTERPLSERLAIIRNFLREEAARTGVPIRATKEAIQALLLYDCPGNVGQLKSDIQVSCARGFLSHITDRTAFVEINLPRLPGHVKRGLIKIPSHRREIDRLLTGNLIVRAEKDAAIVSRGDLYTLPGEIYQFIEDRYAELRKSGLDENEINALIGPELEREFRNHLKYAGSLSRPIAKDDLVKLVGPELMDLVDLIFKEIVTRFPSVDQQLFYCLATHLAAARERLQQGKPFLNPRLHQVKTDYPEEFALAKRILQMIRDHLGLDFPEGEAAFLAMYFRGALARATEEREACVGVVVMTHGRVASGMVEVASRLLGTSHARWFEMSLDENVEAAVHRAEQVVRDADEGKGVLLLVDMGSLLTFGEILSERTGIPICTADRVDTIKVIEATRRAMLPGATLDDLASLVGASRSVAEPQSSPQHSNTDKTILTICFTGLGTAIRLQDQIRKGLNGFAENIEVVPLSAVEPTDLTSSIRSIALQKNIVAVVGSVDPELPGVPFIPAGQFLAGQGLAALRAAVGRRPLSLDEILHAHLLFPGAAWRTPTETIKELGHRLHVGGYVTREFARSVEEREQLAPTIIGNGVAIPHGDPALVRRPAIAIATLREPVFWAGQQTDIVCLLALNALSKEAFTRLYQALKDTMTLQELRHCATGAKMREAVLRGYR